MNSSNQIFLHGIIGNFERLFGANIKNSPVSAIGTLIDTEFAQLEDLSKIVKIDKTRRRSEQHYVVSVSSDNKDFVPTSFLESGIKQSLSVCRISRYFSLSSFRALVKSLETDVEQLGKVSHNFDDINKVIEIFSIPWEIADKIFGGAKGETPLQALSLIGENDLAKILPIPIGTGFLVGGSHLLTNYHVIPDAETADQCVAQFSFVENLQGAPTKSVDYEFDSTLFASNPSLDYTLVQLKSDMVIRQAGFEFGWIRLVEHDENITPGLVWIEFEKNCDCLSTELSKAAINILKSEGYTIINSEKSLIIWHPQAESIESKEYEHDAIKKLKQCLNCAFRDYEAGGDPVIIIQHPKGKQKQIVVNNNEVITNGLYKDFLRYKANADYGSSGSPVFNTRWELVALHHAAVPKNTKDVTSPHKNALIECYQGIRTCSIIKDLKRKSACNSKLKSFIEDFVMTGEQLNYPPLPSALAFDGIKDYIDVTQFIQPSEKATCLIEDSSQFTIEAWVKPSLSDANTTIFSQSCTEPWYEEICEDSVFGRYLLSLQITPECNVVFSREPLWEVSSVNFPSHGLLYPLLSEDQDRRKHPLDVLALKNDSPHLTITSSSEEQMKSLQVILYCLGFFYNCYESENYRETYLNVVNGKLDKNTEDAIKSFNKYVGIDISIETNRTNSHTYSINIPAAAIDIFERRGLCLGLGTKHASNEKSLQEHRGIRIIELQNCLQSLDLNNPIYPPVEQKESQFFTGLYDEPTRNIVKQVQQAFGQPADGILGPSTLAALEQAKSYKVSSRESLPVGRFSHIAVTFNGEEIQLFIDGQLVNRRYTYKHSTGHISQALIGAMSHPSALNSQQSTHNAYFEEAIAEVRLWDKPLLPDAIVEKLYRRLTDKESNDEALLGYWRLEEGRVEDEKDEYDLQFISAESDDNSSKEKRRSILVKEVDHSYHVRIFDELGKMVVDKKNVFSINDENTYLSIGNESSKLSAGDESNRKLIEQLTKESWNSNDELSEKGNLIEELAFKCGYNLRSFYVYNSASNGTPYAFKSKFQNYNAGDTARLRSACNFPTVPLPFGVRIHQELTVRIPNIALSEVSTRDTTITESITKGITLELWVKHEYGDGDILSGGAAETGFYTLKWIKRKIQLELILGSNKLFIETQDLVPNSQTWNHIAFSWDANSCEVNLYLAGKPQNIIALEAQEVNAVSYGSSYKSIVKFAASNFDVGQQTIRIIPNSKANKNFCCSIAELRVWKAARPYNLIKSYLGQRLNKSTEALAGLIAYWRFDNEEDFEFQMDCPELIFSSNSSPLSQSPKIIISDSQVRQFVDVDDQHWAFEFIEGLKQMGLIGSFIGINEPRFRPDEPMTRREFALLLLNTFGGKPKLERANILLQFKDEKDIGNKYLADIEYVWRLGLISGDVITESKTETPGRILEITFSSNKEVNRGIAVSAIYDSLRNVWDDENFKRLNMREGEEEEILVGYEDTPKGSKMFCDWIPRELIAIALKKGLIVHTKPNSKTLDLCNTNATRAEIAAILYQSLVIQDQFYRFNDSTIQQRVNSIESDHILKR